MYGNMVPSYSRVGIGPGIPMGAGTVRTVDDGAPELTDDLLWHRITLQNGDVRATAFDDPPNNPADGNFEQANTIPSPQLFTVYSVIVLPLSTNNAAADYADVFHKGILTVELNQRRWVNGWPLLALPGGGGLSSANTTIFSNGTPSADSIPWKLRPLVIKGGEQFTVKIDFQAAITLAADLDLCIGLRGDLNRRGFTG